MSNNSVVLKAENGYQDFSCIPEMARRICDNGEPGMINLNNIQKYGRFGKHLPDEATLTNPCGKFVPQCYLIVALVCITAGNTFKNRGTLL